MALAAWAADMRPGWCRKAMRSRMSKREVVALRWAGRRKVLILGSVSAKITEGLLPRQRMGVVTFHSTGRPERGKGVSFRSHDGTDTNVERNFKTGASGLYCLPPQGVMTVWPLVDGGRRG